MREVSLEEEADISLTSNLVDRTEGDNGKKGNIDRPSIRTWEKTVVYWPRPSDEEEIFCYVSKTPATGQGLEPPPLPREVVTQAARLVIIASPANPTIDLTKEAIPTPLVRNEVVVSGYVQVADPYVEVDRDNTRDEEAELEIKHLRAKLEQSEERGQTAQGEVNHLAGEVNVVLARTEALEGEKAGLTKEKTDQVADLEEMVGLSREATHLAWDNVVSQVHLAHLDKDFS
ncbi:unnamed protein product [Lupinus luteus]|uniref:Uncharacterized protein n=1 Tax=Lupinus luteus TaxID=3873 RepID=A0AAV1XUT7_LUPLU